MVLTSFKKGPVTRLGKLLAVHSGLGRVPGERGQWSAQVSAVAWHLHGLRGRHEGRHSWLVAVFVCAVQLLTLLAFSALRTTDETWRPRPDSTAAAKPEG